MSTLLFGKSLLLGLAIAAPLGPIGALCINRTLERGFWAGVAGGLGTAFADATYAVLAAAGFAVFATVLATVATPLSLVGGLFMIWLGWKGLSPKTAVVAAQSSSRDLVQTTVATFLLTITNPMTILSFAAIFAGLGLGQTSDGLSAAIVVSGVFAGSLAWWFFLCGGVVVARARLPDRFAIWVARISGFVLIGFGVAAIGSTMLGLL